jgi:hypothetical protein
MGRDISDISYFEICFKPSQATCFWSIIIPKGGCGLGQAYALFLLIQVFDAFDHAGQSADFVGEVMSFIFVVSLTSCVYLNGFNYVFQMGLDMLLDNGQMLFRRIVP